MPRALATVLTGLLLFAPRCAVDALADVARAESEARTASRFLRAAELRRDDETARALYRQAADAAEKALALDPDSARANFVFFAARGRILLAEGGAKNLFALGTIDRYLDKSLEVDPRFADALAVKGALLLELPFFLGGDSREAEKLLRQAVSENPGGPSTRLSLARAIAANGDPQEARSEALRSAHQACVLRRARTLEEAVALLGSLDSKLAKLRSP